MIASQSSDCDGIAVQVRYTQPKARRMQRSIVNLAFWPCVLVLLFSVLLGAELHATQVNGYYVGPGANLAGADLTGASLSDANLAGANLTKASLRDANLFHASLLQFHALLLQF